MSFLYFFICFTLPFRRQTSTYDADTIPALNMNNN